MPMGSAVGISVGPSLGSEQNQTDKKAVNNLMRTGRLFENHLVPSLHL